MADGAFDLAAGRIDGQTQVLRAERVRLARGADEQEDPDERQQGDEIGALKRLLHRGAHRPGPLLGL